MNHETIIEPIQININKKLISMRKYGVTKYR